MRCLVFPAMLAWVMPDAIAEIMSANFVGELGARHDDLIREKGWEPVALSSAEGLHPAELETTLRAAAGLGPDQQIRRWGGYNSDGANMLPPDTRVYLLRPREDYFPDQVGDDRKAASQLIVVQDKDDNVGFVNPLTGENHTMDTVNKHEQDGTWPVYVVGPKSQA